MRHYDELHMIFADRDFIDLFAIRGRSAPSCVRSRGWLFEAILNPARECGLLKSGERQRNASTPILAATGTMSCLEVVGEALRQAWAVKTGADGITQLTVAIAEDVLPDLREVAKPSNTTRSPDLEFLC